MAIEFEAFVALVRRALTLDGFETPPSRTKLCLLLYKETYLTTEPGWIGRDRLARLFYGEDNKVTRSSTKRTVLRTTERLAAYCRRHPSEPRIRIVDDRGAEIVFRDRDRKMILGYRLLVEPPEPTVSSPQMDSSAHLNTAGTSLRNPPHPSSVGHRVGGRFTKYTSTIVRSSDDDTMLRNARYLFVSISNALTSTVISGIAVVRDDLEASSITIEYAEHLAVYPDEYEYITYDIGSGGAVYRVHRTLYRDVPFRLSVVHMRSDVVSILDRTMDLFGVHSNELENIPSFGKPALLLGRDFIKSVDYSYHSANAECMRIEERAAN